MLYNTLKHCYHSKKNKVNLQRINKHNVES